MIGVIPNVEVHTTETGLDNRMHNVPTLSELKDFGYNISVCKDVNEDVNEDAFVSENVNDNEVRNNDFTDEIYHVRQFTRKIKKTAPSIPEHDVKDLVTNILHDIDDNEKINEHVINHFKSY